MFEDSLTRTLREKLTEFMKFTGLIHSWRIANDDGDYTFFKSNSFRLEISVPDIEGCSRLDCGTIKDPFVCLFPWLPETKIVAMRKAIFLMALPGQLILGVIVAVKNHSLLGGLVVVPITVLTGFYIAKRFSSINSTLNKNR